MLIDNVSLINRFLYFHRICSPTAGLLESAEYILVVAPLNVSICTKLLIYCNCFDSLFVGQLNICMLFLSCLGVWAGQPFKVLRHMAPTPSILSLSGWSEHPLLLQVSLSSTVNRRVPWQE